MRIPILDFADVWKSYDGATDVLRGATMAVEEGEAVVVSGENGSGKTTLLNLAGALDAPTRGAVSVAGRPLAGMGERARSDLRLRTVGFVFQDHLLLDELTVAQNVQLPLRLARADDREGRAARVLESFGIAGLASRLPGELSTGQRQLVAVARALANGPRLLLADEPTASLDPSNEALVMDALRRANGEMGAAVLLTRHDRADAWPGATRFVLEGAELRAV